MVIPARNEELSIGGLLEDLSQLPDEVEVVVVDDDSTDATSAIVEAHGGVKLLSAPELPDGWTGKCWACHVGASGVAHGALVFIDADVRLGEGALDDVLQVHRDRGGLVSVQPWHDARRPYEKLSALFNTVALMGAGAGNVQPTAVFGPVLVTSVSDYRAVGGHAAVRDRVAEDLELGRRYVERGLATTVVSCDRRIRYRMYPEGFRQLVDGWTKNYVIGAGSVPAVRLLAVVVWIIFLGTASIAAFDALSGRGPMITGAVLYALAVAQTAVVFGRVGRFGVGSAALVPVHVALFLAVFARSLWRTLVRRSVVWRGRTVRIDSLSADADLRE